MKTHKETCHGDRKTIRLDAGLFNGREVARTVKVAYSLMQYHVLAGHLPKPSRTLDCYDSPFYDAADIEFIRQWFVEHKPHERAPQFTQSR